MIQDFEILNADCFYFFLKFLTNFLLSNLYQFRKNITEREAIPLNATLHRCKIINTNRLINIGIGHSTVIMVGSARKLHQYCQLPDKRYRNILKDIWKCP